MNKNIKVLLATTWTYPHVGGVSTHMTLLARGMDIDPETIINFNQILVCKKGIWNRVVEKVQFLMRKEKITIHAERMVNLLKDVECDILHCHDAMATWAAGVARKKFNKKYRIVSTVHGPVSRHMIEHGSHASSPEVKSVKVCEIEAWEFADQIIAVDTTQKQICLEQHAISEKIHVIPNAVDLSEIDSKLELFNLKHDPDVDWLLVPRRIAPKNGVVYAIKAMQFLPKRCKLLIAGDGVDEQLCRQLAVELGLGDRVAFLGAVPRDVVLMLFTLAKVTIIPSVESHGIVEATSLACIESMASRVPVIASSIGGLKELIEDQKTGLLVLPERPDEIASAVCKLLYGDVPLDMIIKQARSAVEQSFSMNPWIARINEVYLRSLA